MQNLVATLINVLAEEHSASLEESLLVAAALFEKQRGHGVGWPQVVIESDATAEEVVHLRNAVIMFIRRSPFHPFVGQALSALRALPDPSIKPLYIEVLRALLHHDPGAVYQAMMGLHDLGEHIFQGKTSFWGADPDNIRLAREYLQNQSS